MLRTPCVLSAIALLRKISKAPAASWQLILGGQFNDQLIQCAVALVVQCSVHAYADTNCHHGMQEISDVCTGCWKAPQAGIVSAVAYCEADEEALEGSCLMSGRTIYGICRYSHSLQDGERACTSLEAYSDIEKHSLI